MNPPTLETKTHNQTTAVLIITGAALFGLAAVALLFTVPVKMPTAKNSTVVVRRNPLKVADVTAAISVMAPSETFVPLNYLAGGLIVYAQTDAAGTGSDIFAGQTQNLVLTIKRADATAAGRWQRLLGIGTVRAQATTFSIETVPFTGLPAQTITMRYRLARDTADRQLRVCLGHTDAVQVYVGADGTTYTDRFLAHKTTVLPCTQ